MNYTIGTKIQRKGSKAVWTMIEASSPASGSPVSRGRVHISCMPKNRKLSMSKWIDLDGIENNWVEVA